MNRGAARQTIFRNNKHRIMFLDLLEECRIMFNVIISAYCLMGNHYHLLLSTPDANLARVMRHLNGTYTQRYNRSTKKDGPLFRGRYKAKLIDDDCYQLIVSRYIHLNPVEAKLVTNPANYEWSSYRAYLDLEPTPLWLSKDIIINQLTEIVSLSHVKNYQDYVENQSMEGINVFHSTKFTKPIVGSEQFKEKILSALSTSVINASITDYKRAETKPTIDIIIQYVCKRYQIHEGELIATKRGTLNWPRLACIYLCRKFYGYTLRSITDALDCRHTSTISTAINKCVSHIKRNPSLLSELNDIHRIIKLAIIEADAPLAKPSSGFFLVQQGDT